jgi:hypothetical protein
LINLIVAIALTEETSKMCRYSKH